MLAIPIILPLMSSNQICFQFAEALSHNAIKVGHIGNKSRQTLSTSFFMSPPDRSPVGFSTKKSPLKYIRIKPKSSRNNKSRQFELQPAVATLGKTMDDGTEITIDLHSQLHFGEESYFQFYNNVAFTNKYDSVFYELIVSESLLHKEEDGLYVLLPRKNIASWNGLASNPNPVSPPLSDESTASSYGLACQVNIVDYTKPNWIHCDATREEYLSFVSTSSDNQKRSQPLWALASTAMSPIQEYATVLVQPLTPSTVQRTLSQISSRRLFSNLFLPGANLATTFRLFLWIFTPSPELSVLLLDWSSIVNPKPSGMISPIFGPSLQSLFSGNLIDVRKLIFAQLLVNGQTAGGQDLNLVRKRNSVALKILIDKIERPTHSATNVKADINDQSQRSNHNTHQKPDRNSALLYGAMHCQDLQSRLEKMGYHLKKVEWRKAWSVSVPTFGKGLNDFAVSRSRSKSGDQNPLTMVDFVSANNKPSDISISLVVVPLYLLIGGMDWIGTVENIAQILDERLWVEAIVIVCFYVFRHLALYIGLSKFVVEWDGESILGDN
mmetsp:Transcript_18727/g.22954  ORF Transcript_18727/g.22954 Transcript_18727/m.22954 type:complete len:553 (+) Transcript_18727:76-1734(+)